MNFLHRLTRPRRARPLGQRVFVRISQPFKNGHLFGAYTGQPKLGFRNGHRPLAQEWIVVALTDGVHHLLDLSRHGGILVIKCSKPVPARVAARARLAGAGARAPAPAAVDPVCRDLFCGAHCPPSPGPAIEGDSRSVSLNSPSIIVIGHLAQAVTEALAVEVKLPERVLAPGHRDTIQAIEPFIVADAGFERRSVF